MELKKQQVLNLILEQSYEVDEMASKAEFGYDTKGRSQYDLIKDRTGQVVGWEQMDYTDTDDPQKMPIIYVCGGSQEIQRILEENPEMIQALKQKYGETPIHWAQSSKPAHQYCLPPRKVSQVLNPLPGEEQDVVRRTANMVKPVEKPRSVHTKITLAVREAVETQVGLLNEEATKRLEECSVPIIYGRERTHLNRHVEQNNSYIKYQTHNFDVYTDVDEFIAAVTDRSLGVETDVKPITKKMRYRYNEKYSKWSETRPVNINDFGQKQSYQGKTDVYNFDRLDFSESENALSVFSELTLIGELDQTTRQFTWTASFEIKFGEALMEVARSYQQKLEPVNTLTATTTADLSNIGDYDSDGETPITDLGQVHKGLYQVLNDLKSKFFTEIDPLDAVNMPNLTQQRLAQNAPDELQETIVDRIMYQILNPSKNK